MRCQHCSLALWFLGTVALPSQAKNIMRRSQAHIASDGAILQQILDFASSETDSAMPVYKLYFNLQGKHMCWQRESEGCRSSAAECNVEYCHADDPGCDCMKVGFRNCSESRLAPLQLFVETMKQPDGNFPDHTYYWRQLRVKYYDSSEWGDRSHDFGKALESYLACNTEPCKCRSESIFRFAWDGSRLVNVEEETRRSVGPSPFHVKTGDTTLTLREYNMRLKDSAEEDSTTEISITTGAGNWDEDEEEDPEEEQEDDSGEQRDRPAMLTTTQQSKQTSTQQGYDPGHAGSGTSREPQPPSSTSPAGPGSGGNTGDARSGDGDDEDGGDGDDGSDGNSDDDGGDSTDSSDGAGEDDRDDVGSDDVENLGDFDHYCCSRNCHHFQIHFNHSNNYFHVNNDEHYDISDKDNYDNDDTILPLLLHLQIAQKLEWLCQRVMAEGDPGPFAVVSQWISTSAPHGGYSGCDGSGGRFEENQSLIGEWNLEAPAAVRGYTKLLVPKTSSEKIKAGGRAVAETVLAKYVRKSSIGVQAGFHNYVTQDAVRKVIFSGSSNVGDWVPAQAIDLPNTATERSPSAEKHSVSEHVLDVPISERYFFTDFTRYPGKACGGYELEDMKGLGGSEQRCRAQCAARLDCAAVEVVHSGASAGSCIFHSNIWIPTRSLEDERDCFVREGQAQISLMWLAEFHGLDELEFRSNASEDLRPSKTIKVNTGIEIRNYGRWFTATSTYMCWIRPTFVRLQVVWVILYPRVQLDQTWYFIFRSSGYTMHNPEDGSWAVEFQCKGDKARLMIWTRQPAGLGAVSTEFKAKARWADRWILGPAVVMRVGGAFPQLYLNGLPEEVEDSSAPWSELEDIVYNENQYLIIGKDGFIDHFEIYEESLTPQFMRKHYNTIESAKDEGALIGIKRGYIIQGGSAARNSFDVSSALAGRFIDVAAHLFILTSQAAARRSILAPVVLCVALCVVVQRFSAAFLPSPAAAPRFQPQLRAAEAAAISTGLTLAGATPALATWGEGSEAGQNIDPDSTEAYNRKILNATAICLTFAVFLVGLVVSQARKLVENRHAVVRDELFACRDTFPSQQQDHIHKTHMVPRSSPTPRMVECTLARARIGRGPSSQKRAGWQSVSEGPARSMEMRSAPSTALRTAAAHAPRQTPQILQVWAKPRHAREGMAAGPCRPWLAPVLVGLALEGRRRSERSSRAPSRSWRCRTARRALEPGSSPENRIRNFSIIAHIDHGKSTLADRLLEITNTVTKEDMKQQLLDNMDIERERGITIKLNTARMDVNEGGEDYVLNLIDTPGHVDFTYEVSRSLAACEGALLVVDATQGVQAQTLANVTLALEADLEIVPVLNKCDLPSADPERVCKEIEDVVGIDCSNALQCSAKTGEGVPAIIKSIIDCVPAPAKSDEQTRMRLLVFDSFYDNYRGVIAMFRVVDGSISKGQKIRFKNSGKEFLVEEIGIMIGGARKPVQKLSVGEVGYVCANIKTVGDARVGDTIIEAGTEDQVEALPGYTEATPMVFCGLFPAVSGDFDAMRSAFDKLSLNDAALFYQPENSVALGLGFRCGFLGVLHMEVVKERLEREYDLDLIVTAPSVEYQLEMKDGSETTIQFANMLPPPTNIAEIREPYCMLELIVPEEHMGPCMELAVQRRGIYRTTSFLTQGRALLEYEMPMAEMIRDFFAELKSRSRGYASMDYRILDFRPNDLVKLEVDINKTTANPLAQIVHRSRVQEFARKIVKILKEEIPAQQIKVIIQARIGTHIIASENIKAVRKDVLAKCYGGDISRKKKLLQKQAAGKKKMQAIGKVNVPSEAILAVIKQT
ncbi:lepA [Symbiodinium microadriaticum]|nr:lepA [Symbiodinium microadriaticum]